jgi:hypothetical protein
LINKKKDKSISERIKRYRARLKEKGWCVMSILVPRYLKPEAKRLIAELIEKGKLCR